MVHWQISPLRRCCDVSAKPNRQQQRWQCAVGRRQLSIRRRSLRGGAHPGSTPQAAPKIPLVVRKLRPYMEIMTLHLSEADLLTKIAGVSEDLEIFKHILIQVNNHSLDPELQHDVLLYCCAMLNKIDVALLDVQRPGGSPCADDNGFRVSIDGLGDLSFSKSLTISFPSDEVFEQAPITTLLKGVPELPELILLAHVKEPEFADYLEVTKVGSQAGFMTLALQSSSLRSSSEQVQLSRVYRATLKVTWAGPSNNFAQIRARLHEKMHHNFAMIQGMTNKLRQTLCSTELTNARAQLADPTSQLNVQQAFAVLRYADDVYNAAVGDYRTMHSLRQLYIDPDNRNTLDTIYANAGEDRYIIIQLQSLADELHTCKKKLEKAQSTPKVKSPSVAQAPKSPAPEWTKEQ